MSSTKWIEEVTAQTYNVVLNHDLSFREMIDAGAYDQVNLDITEFRFLRKGGPREVELRLRQFGSVADGGLQRSDKLEFRPATFQEICAFGASYPWPRLGFSIMTLEPNWRNIFPSQNVKIVFLSSRRGEEDMERILDLTNAGKMKLLPDCWMLAARK